MADALKLSFQDLAVLDWLLEKPGRFMAKSSLGSGSNRFDLYELSEKNEDGKRTAKAVLRKHETESELTKRFGGKIGINSVKLYQNGFFNYFSSTFNRPDKYAAFVDGLTSNPFHWSDTVYIPTKQALEWWKETGQEAFRVAHKKRKKEREAVERRVLIGCRSTIRPAIPEQYKGKLGEIQYSLPKLERKLIRPYAVATVTKETATRLYIDDVERLNEDCDFSYRDMPIRGNTPNQYIEHDHVMVDNITARGAARLVEFDQEYAADIARIAGEALEQIIPIISAVDLRQKQKEAERLDLMREMIDSLKADQTAEEPAAARKP